MIVPINNGRTTTLIYTPTVLPSNSGTLQQSNTNTQNNEPTLVSWIVAGTFLILFIIFVVCSIKLLKYFLEDEERS